jgi:hypothetical protein
MGRSKAAVLLGALAALVLPGLLAAQETRVMGWAGMLMNPGVVVDHESGTRWEFGSSLMLGGGAQRALGQGLVVGVDLGYSPVRHEVWDINRQTRQADGRAHIVTAMLTGRLGAGRAAGFDTYLTGGVGTMIYGIPDLDRWDPDLALRGGGGVEYATSPELALFLEWNRWWVFHQTEGVRDNTVNHGTLELGVRARL